MLRGSFGTAVCKGLSAEGMLLLERDDGTVIKYDRTDEEYEIL
jgi:hypothetical protein